MGARDAQRRDTAVQRLRATGADAFGVPLDVTDDASAAAAADLIADQAGGLDALINNAAITGTMPQTPATVDPANVRIPGIDMGPVPAAYATSKTLLNALTVHYAKELADTDILINAVCPGYTATDLNAFRGTRTPHQGAAIAIHLATLPDTGPTGGFFDDAGPVPW
ncbi:SDR family NAD(P)-dependent oxidoreductase [Nocardia sp. NPDC127579]|uniref:SDR family NAD(P)-dependent oxidoreductase n=1 Tax=Nocardia sp. NPDC127579 TaxID=3345402 RepID=UPI00363C9EC6